MTKDPHEGLDQVLHSALHGALNDQVYSSLGGGATWLLNVKVDDKVDLAVHLVGHALHDAVLDELEAGR